MTYRPIRTGPVVTPQATPRDTTAVDQALTAQADAQNSWTAAVADTDAKLTALEVAQQEYNDAKDAEAVARAALESADQNWSDAYTAVPKEDTLP